MPSSGQTPSEIGVESFKKCWERDGDNVWCQPKCFRRYLFGYIGDRLKMKGKYVDVATDYAMMLPLIEGASHPEFIEIKRAAKRVTDLPFLLPILRCKDVRRFRPTIQYRADTIDIVMPKGMYDMLGHLGEKEGNLPFIYSSFAVPALAQTISLLKNSDPSDDSSFAASHDSDRWLGILLEKTGSLDELSFEECWQKAETLLGKPVNSAIDGLKKQRDLAIQKGGSGND